MRESRDHKPRSSAPGTSAATLSESAEGRGNFDSLRLGLAALVVFSHSFELLDRNRGREPLERFFHTYHFGDLAVDGFFLLSGFLVIQSWQRDPHVLRYSARRALRLYPAFFSVTLLCGLGLGPLFGGGAAHYFALFRPLEFLRCLLLLREPGVPPVFVGSPYVDSAGSLWTLQYEVISYGAVALAGAIAARAPRLFWGALLAAALGLHAFAPGLVERIAFPASALLLGDSPAVLMRFLGFFAAGIVLQQQSGWLQRSGAFAAAAGALAVASLVRREAADLLLPTAGGYALLWLAIRPQPSRGPARALREFVRRNDLSYGLYVYGWPVQQILIRAAGVRSVWLLTPLALLGASGCAWLSWRFIERPCLGLKPQARPPVRMLGSNIEETGAPDAADG